MRPYEVYMHLDLLSAIPKSGPQRLKIIGDYAITYWVDSPVRAVMVVDVKPADK